VVAWLTRRPKGAPPAHRLPRGSDPPG
jgi:hypothetical protein